MAFAGEMEAVRHIDDRRKIWLSDCSCMGNQVYPVRKETLACFLLYVKF